MECGEGCQKMIPNRRIRHDSVFIQIICVIHCLGFSPSLFTSPQLFLLPALLHPSTFPSTPNTFVPVPKKMLGAESVERSEQGWKAERFKKQRELHEVGVMGRITMKGWGVGRHERQMDGEKQRITALRRAWVFYDCVHGD